MYSTESNIKHQEFAMQADAARAGETSTRSLMQEMNAELERLISGGRSNLDLIISQRGRLLGDLPPSPNDPTEKDRLSGGSVSFADIGAAIRKLDNILSASHEHLMALKKIG